MILCLFLTGCGSESAPPPLLPDNLSLLDPSTVELIEQQAARISVDPGAASYGELGLIYEANLLWAYAHRAFEAAVNEDPQSTWWRFHLALSKRETEDPQGSLRLLQALARGHPDQAPIQQRLGEALTETGDLAGAEAAYHKVIELEPDRPEGYHGLGEVKLLQRDHAAAVNLLERALALNPRYRVARYPLGLAYRGMGRMDDAKREMAYGVDTWPQYLPDPLTPRLQQYTVNLPARRNHAAAALRNGRPDQAAALLEKILEEQPHNITDMNNLAIAYMRMGRLEEAHSLLGQARDAAPEKFSTWLNLSSLAARNGDHEAALKYAREAAALAPDIARVQVTLARAEAEMGNLESTADALEHAVQLDPRDPQARGMLAEISVELGRPDIAERQFLAVLEMNPKSLTALLGLGRLYLRQGRLDEARAIAGRANELAPGHPRIAAFEAEIAAFNPEARP